MNRLETIAVGAVLIALTGILAIAAIDIPLIWLPVAALIWAFAILAGWAD
jgi:hypothetical protein